MNAMKRIGLGLGLAAVMMLGGARVSLADLGAVGLFSTGSGLAEGSADTRWEIISAPSGYTTPLTPSVTHLDAFPGTFWWFDNADPAGGGSKWIAPFDRYADGNGYLATGFGDGSDAVGDYTYRTTFDMTGYDRDSANISLTWWSDNKGKTLVLNGTTVWDDMGVTPDFPAVIQFQVTPTLAGFSLNPALLNSGLNTLDFTLYNAPQDLAANDPNIGNPSSIRVLFAGQIAAVPEPVGFAWGVTLLCSGGIVWSVRRRRRTSH